MAMGNPLGAARASNKGFLRMTVEEYLMLLDWTGRQLREGKDGVIPAELASILQRLGIRADAWVDTVGHYDSKFRTAVGRVAAIRAEAVRRGRKWLQGLGPAAAAFL
jgi:hypothetical protein